MNFVPDIFPGLESSLLDQVGKLRPYQPAREQESNPEDKNAHQTLHLDRPGGQWTYPRQTLHDDQWNPHLDQDHVHEALQGDQWSQHDQPQGRKLLSFSQS